MNSHQRLVSLPSSHSFLPSIGSFLLVLILVGCAATQSDYRLIRAAEQGELSEVMRLVKKGADVNAHDGEGWTPYLAAASKGHWEVMHYLQLRGARLTPDF